MNAAATSASMVGGSKVKKVRIEQSDLPSVIPHRAQVSLQAVAFGKLGMGDLICVMIGGEQKVRRFIKLKMTQNDTLLLTAYEGFGKKEALPKSVLIGRIIEVEGGGRTWDPTKESPLKRFWGRLTEYGTHKPFGLG